MDFYTVQDMRTTPKSLWDSLAADGSVVITNNGKPTALMLDISDGSLEETLKAVRQAKAMIAFNAMRERVAMNGFMTDAEIETEINAARSGKLESLCRQMREPNNVDDGGRLLVSRPPPFQGEKEQIGVLKMGTSRLMKPLFCGGMFNR